MRHEKRLHSNLVFTGAKAGEAQVGRRFPSGRLTPIDRWLDGRYGTAFDVEERY